MNKKSQELLGVDKIIYLQSILLFILAIASIYFKPFLLIIIMITVYTLIFSDVKNSYFQLFFLLPFSMVLKFSPETPSLFTYLMFFSSIVIFIRIRHVKEFFVLFIIFLIIYILLGVGDSYELLLKLISGLILLYAFTRVSKESDFKNYIIAYAFGLLGSSIIGLFKTDMHLIGQYFTDFNREVIGGISIYRFSGLQLDPNYYSIGILLVLYALILLFIKKNVSRILLLPLMVSITYFGFLTYSRLFVLVFILMLTVPIYYIFTKQKQFIVSIFIIGLLFISVYYLMSESTYFFEIIERFNVEDISNNRFRIWNDYFYFLSQNIGALTFGRGIGAPYYGRSATHNTYLELVYYLGLLGSLLYVLFIVLILSSKRSFTRITYLNYFILILFLIMIGTLSLFKANELMFYIMIIWIVINFESRKKLSKSNLLQ